MVKDKKKKKVVDQSINESGAMFLTLLIESLNSVGINKSKRRQIYSVWIDHLEDLGFSDWDQVEYDDQVFEEMIDEGGY